MALSIIESTDWKVDMDEVSAGVYKLVATSKYGCRIEDTGVDPEQLMEKATISARKIDADIAKRGAIP